MQGSGDDFLPKGQLLPKNFVAACAEATVPVVLRMQLVCIDYSHNAFIDRHIVDVLISRMIHSAVCIEALHEVLDRFSHVNTDVGCLFSKIN